MPAGGGGDDRHWDLSLYLSPLPPSGPLRIIAAWPGRGLPETITELTDPFVEAAARVRVLWDLGEPEEPPGPPPLPDLPPGSWFDHRR